MTWNTSYPYHAKTGNDGTHKVKGLNVYIAFDGDTMRNLSLCECCINLKQHEMLTGYCLTAVKCDGCERLRDCAMVVVKDIPKPNENK